MDFNELEQLPTFYCYYREINYTYVLYNLISMLLFSTYFFSFLLFTSYVVNFNKESDNVMNGSFGSRLYFISVVITQLKLI